MAQQINLPSDINLNIKAQGQPGKDGNTPIRGIDYWTKGDQDAIKQWIEDTIWKGKWG
ncbi:hypothetical protein [Limosilactobacillus vaginalis]|uniref:hypothetical protein n=1 Tax=Limosilactobacillus vaginalis TaxID=1633 RepID=UPI000312D7F4|nr:hypothetical protein [Limosilactobacillus vaginalis]KRM49099.1 hypothetical protein FC58_GL000837 [Limosilactobacillus vaginalis DSM 5837 = ATCC 49540]